MTVEPSKFSECQIGREGNIITYANDGSMVFKDRYVSSVRLVDLLNKGGGGGIPAITKEILLTDWGVDHYDQVYDRNFYSVTLYYNLLGINPPPDKQFVRIVGKLIIDSSTLQEIEFDDIIIFDTGFKVVSSHPIHCLITIEST